MYVWHFNEHLELKGWREFSGNITSSRPEVFCKKYFLKNSQNSQEKTCARGYLTKLQV